MVSVIVPVYNVEKYLEACVLSIRHQTEKDLEILLVDDGSTDGSGALCEELAGQDERIQVLHKANGGLSDARNAGIDKACGDFFLFVDGDDRIHPSMVETLLAAQKQTSADMVFCEFVRCSDLEAEAFIRRKVDTCAATGPGFMVECEPFRGEKVPQLLYENHFSDPADIVVAWNKLYRRQLFARIRYPKGRLHEDEYIIHQLLDECSTVTYVPRPLYFYIQRGESITGSWSLRRSRDSEDGLQKRMDYYLSEKKEVLYGKTARKWVDVLQRNYELAGQLPRAERKTSRKEIRKALQKRMPELKAHRVNRRAELLEYSIWSRSPFWGKRVRGLHKFLAKAR